jgi:ribonuclease BN (tRNA processing enzyme)
LRFDGNTSLTLDVHGVKDLRLHFTVAETPTNLDESIGESRFSVVYMGDNREITDVVQAAQWGTQRRCG